jgi:hypothetical protein
MNTGQIQCVIDCDVLLKKHILGVFAANDLPLKLTNFPSGFIINSQPRSQEGQHWLAFYFPSRHTVEFFDSYAEKPNYYNNYFTRYLNAFPIVKLNHVQIQSDFSNVCGLYCLFYLRQRLQNTSMEDIVSMFSSNLTENDVFIYEYMSNIYCHCLNSNHVYIQSCKCRIKFI